MRQHAAKTKTTERSAPQTAAPDQAPRPRIGRRAMLIGGMTILACGVISYRVLGSAHYDGQALSVQDAHAGAIAGRLTLIDIRRPDEWQRTGIGEGAHPIDMRRDDFLSALTAVAGADRDAPIALICAGGVRSARLGSRLAAAGFTRIIDVPEGMMGSKAGPGWLRSGLPVDTYEDTTG